MRGIVLRVPLGASVTGGTARPHPFSIFAFFVFVVSFAQSAFQKGTRMRRIDLVAATMQGWSRLDPAQRDPVFRGVRQCGVAARPGCDAGLASEAAPKQAARRSGRSGGLCDFGSRHGASAERVALENGRCRSRDRTVGTLRPCSPSGRRAPPRHHLHPRKGRNLGQRQRSFGAHAMFSRT